MIDINAEFRGMSWDDVVGSGPNLVLKNWSGLIPQVVLFSGPYGCGKNLHAYLLAQELENVQITVRNTIDSTAKGAVDLIVQFSAPPLVPTVHQVCILNEFTLFRRDAQAKFKDIFQAPPVRTYFFVCTNEPEKIIPDVLDRFRLKVEVDLLNGKDAYELVEMQDRHHDTKLGIKTKLAIARGSKGRPRTIINTIKAIKDSGENNEVFIKDMLQVHSGENAYFMHLFHALVGNFYYNEGVKGLKELLEQTIKKGMDADSIRYKMLGMIYKNYTPKASALYLALIPNLERSVEKHDLFIRFLRVLKFL